MMSSLALLHLTSARLKSRARLFLAMISSLATKLFSKCMLVSLRLSKNNTQSFEIVCLFSKFQTPSELWFPKQPSDQPKSIPGWFTRIRFERGKDWRHKVLVIGELSKLLQVLARKDPICTEDVLFLNNNNISFSSFKPRQSCGFPTALGSTEVNPRVIYPRKDEREKDWRHEVLIPVSALHCTRDILLNSVWEFGTSTGSV